MKGKSISKKSITIFCIILIVILLFSNIAWFLFYTKEKNDLRHSIMPVTQGDYYQEQLALVNNYKLLRNDRGFIEKYERRAGDPTSETMGFGVFEPGIQSAIEKVLYDKVEEGTSYNVCGSGQKQPLAYQVKKQLPIVIWATTNYEPVNEMWTWRSYDKEYTYTYPKNSHTIVITGVDEEYYYVNDPLQEEGNIKIEKKKLEDSFDSLGRQVVGIELYDIAELQRGGEIRGVKQ